jgi:hypothetical protein
VKKHILIALAAGLILGVLSGCLSMGGGPRGPVDAFVFTSAANPGLPQNVAGAINMQPNPLEITVVAPPGTDVHNLVATLSLNVTATITVVSSGERVVQQNGVTRNDFSAPVMYSIEIPKEKKPWRYKVTVREADTNPRLAQLSIPEDSVLNPAFNPSVTSYTLKVPFSTRQARIGARAESRYLKSITIDGAAAQGSSATGNVDFSSGQERSFIIETTAEDGVSREQYTVTLLRGEPDRNAVLAGLEIGEATLLPAFSPQRQNYSAQVPFAATQVVIRARPQSKHATAALSAAVGSGGARATLPYKGNPVEKNGAVVEFASVPRLPIIVTVTAEDGSILEYLVELIRAEPDHNNFLAALSVAGGILSPGFAPNSLSYLVAVPYAARQLALAAQPQSRFAGLALEPGPAARGAMPPFKGNLASKEGAVIDFQSGDRVSLTVAVTAQDGNVLRYFLDIRRSPPDSNADLASLTVSAGVLSPVFNPRIVSYTLSLPAAAETVSLTFVAASKVAKISSELPLAQSGAAQLIIVPASPGQIVTVNIMVTAEDGTQRLYRIKVSREGVPVGMPDTNARLAVLQVSGAPLTPPFNPALTAYEVKLPEKVASVVVNARAESPAAAVTLDGQPLAAGGRNVAVAAGSTQTVTLEVTAENGAVTRYMLKLTREGAPAAKPPSAGGILVLAQELKLGKREASALAQRVEALQAQALITVRTYRTNDILAQVAAPITARVQGQNTVISLKHSIDTVPASSGGLIEVEVAIPTSAGRYLCYTEARPFDGDWQLEVPFLLLADNPRVTWPAIGTPVKVAGYLSQLPSGKAKKEEDFEKNDKGEYGTEVELKDPKTAKPLGKDTVWTKSGPARGKRYAFGRALELPEGSTIAFLLKAKGKGGKNWQASGTTQVWTTMLSYDGGFAQALLFVADELK